MKHQAFHFSALLLCLLFSFPILSFAQDSESAIDKNFDWSNADETKTIYIDIKKGADKIKMDFEGEISQGNLNVTAYNPEGSKVAGFSLNCSGSDGSHVNVYVSGDNEEHSNYHYDTNGNSNSNSNSNSNTNSTSSGSNSTVTVTTTEGGGSGKSKNKNKSKSKNKNKSKSKHVHKNVEKDGKNYSMVSTNSDSKGAKGVMKKRITDPSPGKWKFVITVAGVSGTLSAEVDQD